MTKDLIDDAYYWIHLHDEWQIAQRRGDDWVTCGWDVPLSFSLDDEDIIIVGERIERCAP